MNWFTNIFSGSVGSLVKDVGDVVDKFNLSGEEKQQFQLEMEALIQKRDSEIEASIRSELQSKERVLVAELAQGDSYTKRARPTVVYAGLLFIFINYCLVPIVGKIAIGVTIDEIPLPTNFWLGWSGIVATWSIGRSFEKSGVQNSVTRALTGSSATSKLLGETEVKG